MANKIILLLLPFLFAVQPIKTVYLTFDADMTRGMQAQVQNGAIKNWYDPELFKYLEQEKIPATIFVTGLFVETYPDLIKELSKSGLIKFENHSFDHLAFTSNCYNLRSAGSDQQKNAEIVTAQSAIKLATGTVPEYFRFPGLCHTEKDLDLVKQTGLKILDADVVAGDAFNKNAQSIENKVLGNTKSGDVILFHVGGPNAPKTLEALKKIVPKLKERGLNFGVK